MVTPRPVLSVGLYVGQAVFRGRCPAASSSLSRFSQSSYCLSRKTVFNTCEVLVCSWVHLSRVFGSSFRFVIICLDMARLSSSLLIIWDRSVFSSRSALSIILGRSCPAFLWRVVLRSLAFLF